MSEQELQAIKEQLASVPEGWSVSEGARIVKGLKVSGNYLAAEVEFLHVQRDSQAKIIEEVRTENKRLRAALEKIAYTTSIKELYEAEAFADRVLRGESDAI